MFIWCDDDVVTFGNVPVAPVLERQVTRQTIETLAENKPLEFIADECRYIYMHGDGNWSPINSVHRTPGPIHVLFPEPRNPSPGLNISFIGVAVVVTVIGPWGVGIHAVTDFGCHTAG